MLRIERILAVLLFAVACFSQSRDCGISDPQPLNGFVDDPQGYNFYPGNKILYTYCALIVDPETGQTRGINGATVHAVVTAVNGSGGHSHELVGTQRPAAQFRSPNPSVTAINGCTTFALTLPPWAGWYTINGVSTFGRTGINLCARYWAGSESSPSYPIAYPDNTNINEPQKLLIDSHHFQGHRFLLPSVVVQLTNASTKYANDTLAQLPQQDRLFINRGSLAYGGNADNEGPGYTPDGQTLFPLNPDGTFNWAEWYVRNFETHAEGVEVDISNPEMYYSTAAYNVMTQALGAYNCKYGTRDSYGNKLPIGGPILFWVNKDIVHVVCKANSLLGGVQ